MLEKMNYVSLQASIAIIYLRDNLDSSSVSARSAVQSLLGSTPLLHSLHNDLMDGLRYLPKSIEVGIYRPHSDRCTYQKQSCWPCIKLIPFITTATAMHHSKIFVVLL